MGFPTKTLHDVMADWDSDADVLRQWGHERQATILTQCRTVLEELIEEEGRVSIGTVLTVWRSDAEVLDRYGHPDEATALLHCTDTLRKVVNGAGSGADGNDPSEGTTSREVYVSKDYRRARAPAPRSGRPESPRRPPDRKREASSRL